MSKHITFEERWVQVSDGLLRSIIKPDGIILGMSKAMTVDEVEQWIKGQEENIDSIKDDIRVAKESIKLYKEKFSK